MTVLNRMSGVAALAAALSMAASPVAAAELPAAPAVKSVSVAGAAQWDSEAATKAERHRRWRHRRHRVDAGDIITGVLILGGIAAIADAASKNDRRRADYRYPERRDTPRARSGQSGQGIDRAVDMCLAEIERDVRVDQVDNVSRNGEGWAVSGRIYSGEGFLCRIGNNGEIESIDFTSGRVSYGSDGWDGGEPGVAQDNQWSDDTYAEARLRTGPMPYTGESELDAVEPASSDEELPAYPGGPLPGDLEQDGYGG